MFKFFRSEDRLAARGCIVLTWHLALHVREGNLPHDPTCLRKCEQQNPSRLCQSADTRVPVEPIAEPCASTAGERKSAGCCPRLQSYGQGRRTHNGASRAFPQHTGRVHVAILIRGSIISYLHYNNFESDVSIRALSACKESVLPMCISVWRGRAHDVNVASSPCSATVRTIGVDPKLRCSCSHTVTVLLNMATATSHLQCGSQRIGWACTIPLLTHHLMPQISGKAMWR